MPRHTRKITKRVDVNTAPDREVQLQTNRRFFSSSGNDRAIREAKALQNAFGVGQQFVSNQVDRNNVKGEKRATGEAGSGQDRDREDKNFAYNKAWDEMDAERDVNLMAKELPEILRGADWENLDEDEVRGVISNYMESQFAGIDPEGFYGQAVSKSLIAMELELVGQHRQEVINRIQAEQRNTIMANVQSRWDASLRNPETGELDPLAVGEFPYDYLQESTGRFFDGAAKRKVYWETLFDFATKNGLPDIIRNAPLTFTRSGDPTGMGNPLMQDEIRAEIKSATIRQAKIQKDRDDLIEAQFDTDRFGAQMNIYRVGQKGLPVDRLIRDLENIPGTKFSDVSAAKGFADTQFAESEQRSPQFDVIGNLYANIHTNKGSAADQMASVFAAAGIGELGFGDTAVNNMNGLIATIEKYQKNAQVLHTQEAGLYRASLNTRFNDATGGLLAPINPLMQRVKIDALDQYNDLVLGGMGGQEALNKVIEKFDVIVRTFPQIEEKEIVGRRDQSDFTASTIEASDVLDAIETGDRTFFAGVPYSVLENRVIELEENGGLSPEQIEAFADLYN